MQVSVFKVQLHPVPMMAVAVKPAGKASVTVTVPTVAPPPTLLVVNVNVAAVSPGEKVQVCVFAIVRSGRAITRTEAVAVLPVSPFVELTAPVTLT